VANKETAFGHATLGGRAGGVGGGPSPIIQARGWEAESLAWAESLSGFGVGSLDWWESSDFNDGKINGIASAQIESVYSSGVYSTKAAGTDLVLGNTSTQTAVAAMASDIWVMRTRMRLQAATVAAGKFVRTGALFDFFAPANAAGNGFEIIAGNDALVFTDPTQFYAVVWHGGTIAPTVPSVPQPFSCGPAGKMGALTCPTSAFFTIGVAFNGTTIRVYFNDALALTLSGVQLNNLPATPGYYYFGGNAAAIGQSIDAVFVATQRSL